MTHLRAARPILSKLTRDFPDNAAYQTDLDVCLHCMKAAEQDLDEAKQKK
jgi:hypothetical protein